MNSYLQTVRDAHQLPEAYEAMGTSIQERTDSESGVVVRGWILCELIYKMNEDGREWWSNRYSVMVDTEGELWELYEAEQYSPYESPQRTSTVSLARVDGEKLRFWDVHWKVFGKIKGAIKALI